MRILFFFCLIFSFSVDAQKVELGPSQKLNKREAIQGIVHHDATGFYVLRSMISYQYSSSSVILEKYGNDLVPIFSTELVMEKNYTLDEIFGFQGKLYASFNVRDKGKNKISYYIQELSTSKGVFIGKKKLINTGKMEAKNSRGSLISSPSLDTSHIAFFSSDQSSPGFYFGLIPFGNNSRGFNQFKVNIYDAGMNEIWKKNIKMPYENEDFKVRSYRVDNEGNLYMLIQVYLDNWKKKKRNLQPYKKFQILAYTNQGESKRKYDIKVKNRFITDITFEIDNQGNIVCAGFNNDSARGSIGGAFYFVMNKETEDFIQENYKDFDIDELALFMKARKAEKGKEISANFRLDNLIMREDGGVILLAEYFDVQVYNDFSNNGGMSSSRTRTVYLYDDVLVLSINPEGNIDWLSKLPKSQRSETTRYSSYNYAIVDDKIHFVYNGRISRRTDVQLTYIDMEGRLGGKGLFNAKEEKVLLLPTGCRQINDREMIIYGEWRRKFQFGKVSF